MKPGRGEHVSSSPLWPTEPDSSLLRPLIPLTVCPSWVLMQVSVPVQFRGWGAGPPVVPTTSMLFLLGSTPVA